MIALFKNILANIRSEYSRNRNVLSSGSMFGSLYVMPSHGYVVHAYMLSAFAEVWTLFQLHFFMCSFPPVVLQVNL